MSGAFWHLRPAPVSPNLNPNPNPNPNPNQVRFGIYDRHLASGPANAHEVLIESVLASLSDASRWVEYWGRAGWQAVPAHSDLDEVPLLAPRLNGGEAPRPRFPRWGHIVYLDVANGQPAPTVLYDDADDGRDAAQRRFYVVHAG